MCLPVTCEIGGTRREAKIATPVACGQRTSTRGTQNPSRADELLLYKDSVHDGNITLPIQEGTQNNHPLSSPLPDLVDVRRPGESCI